MTRSAMNAPTRVSFPVLAADLLLVLGMSVGGLARAACPTPDHFPGDVNIETWYHTFTNDVHTPVTRTEILNYLYDLSGHGELRDGAGQSWHWYAWHLVSDTEFVAALADMRALLQADVESVPGTTVNFDLSDAMSGDYFELVSGSYEEVPNHTETQQHTDLAVTCTDGGMPAEEGVDYQTGGSPDPAEWVAANDITVSVDNITDIINYIDDVTTRYGNDITLWNVEAYREISDQIIFLDGFDGAPSTNEAAR